MALHKPNEMLFGYFNVKYPREEIFKQTIGTAVYMKS
jgi:hypothetical protein